MHLTRSTKWVALCSGALLGIAASGCSSLASSVPTTHVTPTPANQTVASATSSPGAARTACFTVSVPEGWTSQVTQHCGLALDGPKGAGVSISVDTEPIDSAALHDLIAEKYSDVSVTEETINGERVLRGTGSVPGAIYIVVQARSATTTETGYYAQGLTSELAQVAEIKRILATVRIAQR